MLIRNFIFILSLSFDMTGEHADGIFTLTIGTLAAGQRTTLNVTITPKLHGIYDSTRARVRYTNDAEGHDEEDGFDSSEENTRDGYSSSMGKIRILSESEYAKFSSYFIKEWGIILALFAGATIAPYFYWRKSKNFATLHSKKR